MELSPRRSLTITNDLSDDITFSFARATTGEIVIVLSKTEQTKRRRRRPLPESFALSRLFVEKTSKADIHKMIFGRSLSKREIKVLADLLQSGTTVFDRPEAGEVIHLKQILDRAGLVEETARRPAPRSSGVLPKDATL